MRLVRMKASSFSGYDVTMTLSLLHEWHCLDVNYADNGASSWKGLAVGEKRQEVCHLTVTRFGLAICLVFPHSSSSSSASSHTF